MVSSGKKEPPAINGTKATPTATILKKERSRERERKKEALKPGQAMTAAEEKGGKKRVQRNTEYAPQRKQ